MLPLFLFDGILAGLDIVPRRKTAPIEGVGKNIFVQFKINVSSFIKTSFKRANFVENIRRPVYAIYNAYYKLLCKKEPGHLYVRPTGHPGRQPGVRL